MLFYIDTSSHVSNETAADIKCYVANLETEDPFSKIGKDAYLELNGFCANVWYRGSHSEYPFNDPAFALVVDIFDASGRMIGTGYLDYVESQNHFCHLET